MHILTSVDGVDVDLDRNGAMLEHGPHVTWDDIRMILRAVPRVARERLGWFPFDGPPSACSQASDEVAEIVSFLFPKP